MHRFRMTITFLISWLMVLIGSVTPQNNIMYVVTSARWPNPQAKVILRTESHSEAEIMYEELSNEIKSKDDGSVVLYNVAKGEVEHLTKYKEPLYTVNCVETARQQKSTDGPYKDETEENTKMYISAISNVLGWLSGFPGAGATIKMLIMNRYHTGLSTLPAAAGIMVGSFVTGLLITVANNRPFLGMIRSMVLGCMAGVAAEGFYLYLLVCPCCNGTGFVDYFERCPSCNGIGHINV